MWIPNLNIRSLMESRAGVSRKVLFSSSPVAFWGAIFHMIFIWCRQKSTAAAFLEIVVFIIICPHLTMSHLVLKSIIFSSIPLMHGVGTFIWIFYAVELGKNLSLSNDIYHALPYQKMKQKFYAKLNLNVL